MNKRLLAFIMMTLMALVLTLMALISTGCEFDQRYDPADNMTDSSRVSEADITRFEKGYRFDKNGWIYIHIEGEPFERGRQHGYLAANELKDIKRSLEYLTMQDTGMDWSYFVQTAEAMFVPMIDAEMLDEIKGIAAGAREAGTDITWQEILAYNGYEELTDYWWPNEQQRVYGTLPTQVDHDHCSAFIAVGDATSDGKPVIAHNSWNNFEVGQFMNEIIDIVPINGHRIVMQTQPGYIHSMADFFVTDAGLAGTETTIGGFEVYAAGEAPEFYRIRMAMQYSDNFDDFVKYMRDHNDGGYANTWLMADNNTNQIMQFEQGLKFDNVQIKTNGFFVGFNAPQDPRIRNLETTNSGYMDLRRHQGARQVRLTELMEKHYGNIDVEIAKEVLADHYDVYLEKRSNPSSRTIDGHYELDAREYMSQPGRPIPFQPRGTVDGKVIDGTLAADLSFIARWGNSSGMPFDASDFLEEHIQFRYLDGYLKDRPAQPWTKFSPDEQ